MTAGSTQRPERLTRDNALLLLVDHQVGLYTGIRDIDVLQLKHNIVGLTRANARAQSARDCDHDDGENVGTAYPRTRRGFTRRVRALNALRSTPGMRSVSWMQSRRLGART